MALSMSGCEEFDAPRCGEPEASRDDADAGDKATQRVAPQPVQAASSTLTDAPHRSASSSLPALDCNAMKSFDNFQNGLLDGEHQGSASLASSRSASPDKLTGIGLRSSAPIDA